MPIQNYLKKTARCRKCAKTEVSKESKQVDIENNALSLHKQSDVERCELVSLASIFKNRHPEKTKLKQMQQKLL